MIDRSKEEQAIYDKMDADFLKEHGEHGPEMLAAIHALEADPEFVNPLRNPDYVPSQRVVADEEVDECMEELLANSKEDCRTPAEKQEWEEQKKQERAQRTLDGMRTIRADQVLTAT